MRRVLLLVLALVEIMASTVAAFADPGSLDRTFGGDGTVLTPFASQDAGVRAVAAQPDGKLVAVGWAGSPGERVFALARYNEDGTLDPAFGDGGKVATALPGAFGGARAVSLQADGKIVVGGAGVLVRFNVDGSVDSSFGSTGWRTSMSRTSRSKTTAGFS